jgi:GntR family transcriptional regulator/MocR family aminotransferase
MPKTAITGLLIDLELEANSELPKYRQIADHLRVSIETGRIPAGIKLPSTRIFAEELGVSRNVILQAFDRLIDEGLLSSRIGDGTYVMASVIGKQGGAAPEARTLTAPEPYPFRSLSRRGKSLVNSATDAFPERPTAFMPDLPDLREFPIKTWLRLLNETSGRLRGEILADTSNAGYEPLRRAIARHLNISRGMTCTSDQVIITTGSQQSLDLVSRMLFDPGDPVWLEEPGYVGARSIFSANGASLCPIAVDEQGLCIDEALAKHPSPRLIFASPSRHYPLGATLSLQRRSALIELASRCGAWIVEDDYDHEFRYVGHTPTSIHGLDGGQRTVHLGTFSKILLPSFRLGYVVVPPDLAEPFAKARAVVDRHASLIEQMVLSEFMHRGLLVAHIRRMRNLYRSRQVRLIGGLRDIFDNGLRLSATDTGMHVLIPLDQAADDQTIARKAMDHGVVLRPLSPYYAGRQKRQGLLLGFSAYNFDEIEQGLARLSKLRTMINPVLAVP